MTKKEKILTSARRYSGCLADQDPALAARLDSLYEKACQVSTFRVVYRLMEVAGQDQSFKDTGRPIRLLAGCQALELPGRLAANMLGSCEQAIVLGATLGIGFDQELKKLELRTMADALLFDAIGSAMIEEELDLWQQSFQKRSEALPKRTNPLFFSDRFSCGYGDLPLDLQSQVASFLCLSTRLGIYVQPSQMMIPSKSVTAFVGLSSRPQPAQIRGCAFCSMAKDCYASAVRFCSQGHDAPPNGN